LANIQEFVFFLYKHEQHAKLDSGSSRDIQQQAGRPTTSTALPICQIDPHVSDGNTAVTQQNWLGLFPRTNINVDCARFGLSEVTTRRIKGRGCRDLDQRAQCSGLGIKPQQKLRCTRKARRNSDCKLSAIRDRDCQSLSTLHTIRHQDLQRLPLRHFHLWR